ncbi:MAG TPA: sigma factor [Clostridiales bacterium]|nr:sigma factor [Clostridiales bacterium]
MQFDALNARISSIRDDAEETGRFVEEYKPFIASCARKVTGRYMSYDSDDELSIAMIAFVEAIKSFDSSKGIFSLFPGM